LVFACLDRLKMYLAILHSQWRRQQRHSTRINFLFSGER
jgi:hypothetical protein